ncbi:hypothetical protein D3C78_1433210 [compost metagenome]
MAWWRKKTLKSGSCRLSPLAYSKVPVMELAITCSSAPTYSGLASILAASRRLPFCSASSHQAARSSAFTSRTWVLGWRSAHCRVTPNTFSGLLRQIS